ncbi:MAG: hypothetical protein IRZ04_18305 [Rhodospirillales bacterium]|nr:hypothetical protein [Rhodospirillales bacterium]
MVRAVDRDRSDGEISFIPEARLGDLAHAYASPHRFSRSLPLSFRAQ